MRLTLIDTARDGTVAAAYQADIPMHVEGAEYERITAQCAWGATDGAWTFEVSNDHRANPQHPDHANAHYDDITAALGLTNPTGVANHDWQEHDIGPVYYLRVTYTPGVASAMLFLAICATA